MKIKGKVQRRALVEAFQRQRLAWLRVSFGAIVCLATVMGFASSETVFASVTDPSPTIRVRIVNYSQASAATLARAEHEAGQILAQAGLETVWFDCSVGHSSGIPHDPCQEPLGASDIVLRVLPEPRDNRFQGQVFGFAVIPVQASVYYDYVLRQGKSDDAEFDIPILLGCVIAHEVGHLLLGSDSHSDAGVMQPRWERKQIQQATMGTLLFTPQQANLIRAEGQRRMSTKPT
jgi:hypothetical protein